MSDKVSNSKASEWAKCGNATIDGDCSLLPIVKFNVAYDDDGMTIIAEAWYKYNYQGRELLVTPDGKRQTVLWQELPATALQSEIEQAKYDLADRLFSIWSKGNYKPVYRLPIEYCEGNNKYYYRIPDSGARGYRFFTIKYKLWDLSRADMEGVQAELAGNE